MKKTITSAGNGFFYALLIVREAVSKKLNSLF